MGVVVRSPPENWAAPAAEALLSPPLRQRLAQLAGRLRSLFSSRARLDPDQARATELAAWNHAVELRVAQRASEIEHLGSRKESLPPQTAQMILSSGDERALDWHIRIVTVAACDLRGPSSTRFALVAKDNKRLVAGRPRHYACRISGVRLRRRQ